MYRYIIVLLIILLPLSANSEYIYFNRIHMGYYNPTSGDNIVSVNSMKGRKGIDSFESSGWAEPDILGFNILNRYYHNNEVILLIDSLSATYISNNKSNEYIKSYIVRYNKKGKKIFIKHTKELYKPSDFNILVLSQEQADEKLIKWGFIKAESGVT